MSIPVGKDSSGRGNYGPAGQEVVNKLGAALGTSIAYDVKTSKYTILASAELDKIEIEKIVAVVEGAVWRPAVQSQVDSLGNKVVELVRQGAGSLSSPSTYVVSKEPGKYGNKQEDYVERFQRAVEQTIETIQRAVVDHTDLKLVFRGLVGELGKVRYEIAMDHDSEYKELFGLSRDSEDVGCYLETTPLIDCYDEYDQCLLMPLVQGHLKEMKAKGVEKMCFPQESCLDRKAYLETSTIKGGNFEELAREYLTPEFYETLCRHCEIEPQSSFSEQSFNLFLEKKELLQKLKETNIEDYKRYILARTLLNLEEIAPSEKKTHWVVTTQRSEVEGKMYALTKYVTWFNANEPKAIDRMAQYSVVTLLHQDIFLIEPMLQDLSKIFERIVLGDKEDINALQKNLSLFVYEFSHAMPYVRGSAAVLEILEDALAAYKGFTLTRNPNRSINLEAICSGPKEFETKYLSGALVGFDF